MIELLPGLPDDTVGVRASGVVSGEDYEGVFVPAVERAMAAHDRVNVLYVLGPGFESFSAGALWDDARFGGSHLTGWGRIALVGDADWARHAVSVGRLFMPGHLRHFPLGQLDAAREWVVAGAG